MFGEISDRCRAARPVVHCISNAVTAGDCANLLLACGASPIMAEEPQEMEDIAALSDALVLNLGMLSARKLEAMRIAARAADKRGRPVVLDPVGVGASRFRREAALELLSSAHIAVVRGNASEIAALVHGAAESRGVDTADMQTQDADAAELARSTGAVVVRTGECDVVTDGKTICRVHNGHSMMRSVTGAGCQLSALLGAFAAACPQALLQASLEAVCAMGLCGETAHARLAPGEGNASYRSRMIDAMYHMNGRALREGAAYEME